MSTSISDILTADIWKIILRYRFELMVKKYFLEYLTDEDDCLPFTTQLSMYDFQKLQNIQEHVYKLNIQSLYPLFDQFNKHCENFCEKYEEFINLNNIHTSILT